MARKDEYDKIREMDIPQEAKNILKDLQVEKEYQDYLDAKRRGNRPPPKKTPPKKSAPKKTTPDPSTTNKAKGGSVSKRADGCAMKGKTRGKMV